MPASTEVRRAAAHRNLFRSAGVRSPASGSMNVAVGTRVVDEVTITTHLRHALLVS
jgi:hypothetical protein